MSRKGRKGSYINGLLKVSKSFIQYCYDEADVVYPVSVCSVRFWMRYYGVFHRKLLSFCCKRQKINGFAEMLDNIYIYIYIYHGVCETALMRGREFIE